MTESRITLILRLFKIHGPLIGFIQTTVMTIRLYRGTSHYYSFCML